MFSVTIHIKENSVTGEELLKIGKLNLVSFMFKLWIYCQLIVFQEHILIHGEKATEMTTNRKDMQLIQSKKQKVCGRASLLSCAQNILQCIKRPMDDAFWQS